MNHQNHRPCTYYPPMRREPDIYREIDNTNRTLSRIGFGVGAIGLGGYFLYKKFKNLNSRIERFESEKKKANTEG